MRTQTVIIPFGTTPQTVSFDSWLPWRDCSRPESEKRRVCVCVLDSDCKQKTLRIPGRYGNRGISRARYTRRNENNRMLMFILCCAASARELPILVVGRVLTLRTAAPTALAR